jgi:hypothetical protein
VLISMHNCGTLDCSQGREGCMPLDSMRSSAQWQAWAARADAHQGQTSQKCAKAAGPVGHLSHSMTSFSR